jgi:two-component system chemotaxis sensor kinase CheA
MLLMYRGCCLPLLSLAGDRVDELRGREDCYVLVFQIEEHEVGLLVPHLVDICDVSLNVDAELFADASVMGTVLIGEEIARLIDPVELVSRSAPESVKALRHRPDVKHPKTVLLAEDSPFFRQQVQRFLESDGFRVIAFEDAQRAWSALESGRVAPDMVVTDIEMPNMNGYEFCRRIRSCERWRRLPVVALTSLSGEENLRRGRDAGFDDYQVKMDRERLSVAVHRLLVELDA